MADATSARQIMTMNNTTSNGSAGSANQEPSESSATHRVRPPPWFGKLPTVCVQPRGHTHRDGVLNFVLPRSVADSGVAHHGLNRHNDDSSVRRTNAPLDHPGFEAYYNYEGRQFGELTALERRQLEMAVHYPNIRGGIMKAPLYFRKGPLTKPEATQPDLVKQVFGSHDIFDRVFVHLLSRYEDLANFCGASQLTARMVHTSLMHLDATNFDFLGWDKQSLSDVRKEEARQERSQAKGGNRAGPRYFSPAVIISPVRSEDQGPVQEILVNRAGYPITPAVQAPQERDFATTLKAHYKLMHFAYLNGNAIKHLVLHSMPWVNIEALRGIVTEMPKLETVGVHQCFLLTFGDTQPFLHAINDINKDRGALTPKQPHLSADFTPFYYKGPAYKANGTGHIGEYGIIPEDKEWLDSQRAITAQLVGIWEQCLQGSQDFFTPGTGFRSFLDRLPMRGLSNIIRCIAAIADFYGSTHDLGVGVPCSRNASAYHPKDSGKAPLITKELGTAMEITVWQDLIIACNDEPMLKETLKDLIVLRGEVKLNRCRECCMHLPAYFYQAHVLSWREQDVICHGCQLKLHLVNHVWRLYSHRRDLARRIFKPATERTFCLSRVLRNIEKPAKEATPAGFGEKAKPAREAIPCIPGEVDVKFLQQAQRIWSLVVNEIPTELKKIRGIMKTMEREYYDLSYGERGQSSATQDLLRRKDQWLEFQLGIMQRKTQDGSLQSTCLSWEQLIREGRANIAIRSGQFVNRGPRHILNLQANVVSMLGRSGGLPEYWKATPSAHNVSQQQPTSYAAVASSSSSTGPSREEPTGATAESSKPLLPHQRRGPQKATQPAKNNSKRSPPTPTKTQPPKKLLPHQRKGPWKATQPAQDGSQHTQLTQPDQATASSSKQLLPHQRPGSHKATQPTQNRPSQTQPAPPRESSPEESNARP
ncbi:hypothetical protein F4859DRAFT_521839 [Xylaria cf. heliscus]|nr:hypothetical protein F4859DRAFT_521839 [Xylaria cf. heliscus]